MSKAVMQQALDTIYHMSNVLKAGPDYDPLTCLMVSDTIDALQKVLEESNENPLTESQEERLQKVEQGLAALGWVRVHKSGGSNPVDFPKFGGCPQRGTEDPYDRCATCDCWKNTRDYCG